VTKSHDSEDAAAAAANSFGSSWGWNEQSAHRGGGATDDEAMNDEGRADAAAVQPAAAAPSTISPLPLVNARRLPPQSKFKPLVRMNK
jgi:hypothetical protein